MTIATRSVVRKTANPLANARFSTLYRLASLDSPAELAFDRLTRLTMKILRAPVAILSLVDGDRSYFKSSVGLPEHWASQHEMPLSSSVCQHVVARAAPLIINDARIHPLVVDNQAVADWHIVAYMGVPLVTAEGHVLGTFAVIDTVPREWTDDDVATLTDLAASAMSEMELCAETNLRLRLAQRLDLMEAVVGNAAAAVLIVEADPIAPNAPRIVFANDAYCRLTGYSREDIVGEIDQVLKLSTTDRSQIDSIRTALAMTKAARLEWIARRKDGSSFWSELNIVPIADKAGVYSHWVVIQRDISEQKIMKESLRESERRRQAIMESSLDCIIVVDGREQVIEFNPAAELAFGYSRAEAVGKQLSDLIPPPPGIQRLGLGKGLYAKNPALFKKRFEMAATRADGSTFPADLTFSAMSSNGPAFAVFLRDITERKRADESIRRSEARYRALVDLLEVKVEQRTRDLDEARIEILQRLSLAAEFRDDDTGQHTQRVGKMAAHIAASLGLPHDLVQLIRLAAPLHDVGKIAIPDAILLKPEKLDGEEFRVMATHATIGAWILSGSQSPLLQLAEQIAASHHEHWDGTGYPGNRRGTEIPLAGRIVSVADVFDALTHERPYKPAWTADEAAAEIKRLSGTKFDPQVVDAFLRLFRECALPTNATDETLTPHLTPVPAS